MQPLGMVCPELQRPTCNATAPSCSCRPFAGIPPFQQRTHRLEACHQQRRRSSQGLVRAVALLSTADFGADREPAVSLPRDGLRNGSSVGAAGKGKEPLKAVVQSVRRPYDRGDSQARTHRDEGLPVSLFAPYTNLPEDGRTLTEFEETCDPYERSCQVPMHVWESKCRACYGTGSVSYSSRRGRRSSSICPSCTGVGYVRRASARLIPNLNGKHVTLGRPPAPLDEDDFQQYKGGKRNGKPS